MKNICAFFIVLLLISQQARAIQVFAYATPETCGNSNGMVMVSVVGGASPYTYMWSNGALTSQISALSSGTYTVTVTDANGDSASDVAVVTNSPVLMYTDLTFVDPLNPQMTTLPCNSMCNGTGYLTESSINGVPPYMMTITSGSPNLQIISVAGINAITNVCVADPFTLMVTDATGCPSNPIPNPFQLTPPSFAFVETTTPACFGGANGAVLIDFIDNSFQLNYNVEVLGAGITLTNVNPVFIDGLLPGSYSLHVQYSSISPACDTLIYVTIPDLGPNCGIISGKVYLDTISNCTADINEPLVPQQIIRFDPGSFYSTSDASGNYSISLPFGTYSATLIPKGYIFPVCNASGLVLSAVSNNLSNVDLGDSINITTDLTAGLTTSAFRPGFPGYVFPSIYNTSTDAVANPSVDIYYDPLLTYQSSSQYTPVINQPGHLQYNLNALNAFSGNSFYIQFLVPANVNLIGTSLAFSVDAHANVPETDLSNNTDTSYVVITGSFDPNDKAVEPARDPGNMYFIDLDSEFNYKIRFQNTGTDTTFNAVIIDTLDAYLDPSTVHIIANSHPMTWEVTGQNVLKFYFNNILLPDSNTNEAASHGAVEFGIKPVSTIPGQNEIIYNRADIYFDFNPPVLTNTVSSIVTISVGLANVSRSNNVVIVPNPANDKVTVILNNEVEAGSIELLNTLGQEILIKEFNNADAEYQLEVNTVMNGYYILRVEDSNGKSYSSGVIISH